MAVERPYLLTVSLIFRVIGIVFLYEAARALEALVYFLVCPTASDHYVGFALVYLVTLVLKIVLAVYFLQGATPALKWIKAPPHKIENSSSKGYGSPPFHPVLTSEQ